MTEKQINSFFA